MEYPSKLLRSTEEPQDGRSLVEEHKASIISQSCNIVVIGDNFSPSMFDERELFGGALDQERTMVAGMAAQFTYRSGTCRFSVIPNRIDIKASETAVLSDDLLCNGRLVFQALEKYRGAVSISAYGINCDATVALDGVTGASYCSRMVSKTRLNTMLLGHARSDVAHWLKGVFQLDGLAFSVRVEPHADTQGQNLFVAINGPQEAGRPGRSARRRLGAKYRSFPFIRGGHVCPHLTRAWFKPRSLEVEQGRWT